MKTLIDIISMVADIMVTISIVIIAIEFYLNRKDQQFSRLYYLHNYLAAEQFAQARYHVRDQLKTKPYFEWTEEDKIKANLVCASYDQAGIIFSLDILNKQLKQSFLTSSWGESIRHQYKILKPYLRDEQAPEKTGIKFFKHFHELYQELEPNDEDRD